jgi:hypothetical protein
MRANYAPYQCKALKQTRLLLQHDTYLGSGDEGFAFRGFDLSAESVRATVMVSEFERDLSGSEHLVRFACYRIEVKAYRKPQARR